MNLSLKTSGLILAGTMLAASAQAGLIDRGNGMIYDTVLDITWLQDANYAKTSGYDADGQMTWGAANTWAADLVYGGYDNWRLPTIHFTDTNNNGQFDCDFSKTGGTDCGYNVLTVSENATGAPTIIHSELAYMFYENLVNVALFDPDGGASHQPGWDSLNSTFTDANTREPVSFKNLERYFYWSSEEYALSANSAWIFGTDLGAQAFLNKGLGSYAWAVRDGDVAASEGTEDIPEPGVLALFGLGLLGLIRRQRLALR